MKTTRLCILLNAVLIFHLFVSCDSVLQGMAAGMAGFGGMGGYQAMPGGYMRNTSYDYLLDPRYTIQQVNQQNQQEYLQQTNGGKTMTYSEWYSKIKAPSVLGTSSSGSSGSSSSYSGSSSSSSSRDCRRCMGTGKCQTCNGRGYYDKIGIGSGRHLCPNCASNHNGKCASCNGTGKM